MDFSKINVESVAIGSFIGLFIKTSLDRITTAVKLNRQRKVLIDYSKFIGLEKSLKFIEDLDFVKQYILADTEEEITKARNRNYAIDAMPMFTSAIFKSFSQDEQRRTTFSTRSYITLLDITYSIDFLKEYMPLDLWGKYQAKVREHMKEEKIKPEEEIKHFQDCGFLKYLAETSVNELEMKRERSLHIHEQFHEIVLKLDGWGWIWIFKYIFRQ